jgi:hypothetical protein
VSLDLSPEQPAESDAAEQPATMSGEPMVIVATLATVEGDILRIYQRGDGNIVLQPGGRKPIMLDQLQAMAFRAAVQALAV